MKLGKITTIELTSEELETITEFFHFLEKEPLGLFDIWEVIQALINGEVGILADFGYRLIKR